MVIVTLFIVFDNMDCAGREFVLPYTGCAVRYNNPFLKCMYVAASSLRMSSYMIGVPADHALCYRLWTISFFLLVLL